MRMVLALFFLVLPSGAAAAGNIVYYGPAPQCLEVDSFPGIRATVPVAAFAIFSQLDGMTAFAEPPLARQSDVVQGGFGSVGTRFILGDVDPLDQFRSLDLRAAPCSKHLGVKMLPDGPLP